MPNPGFKPNEPGYYKGLKEGFPIISKYLGITLTLKDQTEMNTALESKENLHAMLTACMPKAPDNIKALKELLQKAPGMRTNPADQQKRHDLSVQARKAIVDTSVKIWAVNNVFDAAGMDRNFRSLLLLDDSENGMKDNRKTNDIMVNGTPDQRGEVLTKRVMESEQLFQRIMNNELTDEELVQNFEKILMFQNLTANAQMFVKTHIDSTDPKLKINVSPEIREKLVLMERHSAKFSMATDRVRMIASANYEHLDLEYLLTADYRTYQKIEDYLDDAIDFAPYRPVTQKEIATVTNLSRESMGITRTVNLMEQIEKDFDLEKDQATLQYVGIGGELKTATWTYKGSSMDRDFEKGYVMVTTPSGDAGCYRVTPDGKVTRTLAKDMLNDIAADMQDALGDVALANKGFFIGSRAYSQAFRALKALPKSANDLGNPPDPAKVEALRDKLQRALQACGKYKATKDSNAFKNDREQQRYEAMDKAAEICQKQLHLIEMYKKTAVAEKDAE